MSKIKNTANNNDDVLVNEVRAAIEHRATWMGLILDEAAEAGADFEALGRAAVKATGCFHGQSICAKMNGTGMKEFQKTFLHDLGQKLFEMEIKECDDEKLEIEFNYCALVSAWQKQNFNDEKIELLCDIAMDGDRGIAEANNFDFVLGKTIAKGDDICEVNFYKKK